MGRKRQLPLISGISWKRKTGEGRNGIIQRSVLMPILRKYTGEATGVWRHFQRKILFFPISGQKNIQTVRVFLLTDANGVCVENLEEGNSMYLGETLEIEDSWKNDHKKRMISLKSDRAGLYITGMIGSNHFSWENYSTNSILILFDHGSGYWL